MPAGAAVIRAAIAPRLALSLLLLAPLASACDDGLTESTRGSLLVSQIGGATGISERTDVSFMSVRPNTTSSAMAFLLSNPRDEGDLQIEKIEFVTESPFITATLSNAPPDDCSGAVCTFEGFTIEPLRDFQLDLRYEPTAVDNGCGQPPADLENPPSDYCGHVRILSDDPGRPEIFIVLRVPELSGELQVCLVETGECAEQLVIDFNAAAVGDPAQTKRFTVNNTGTQDLTVSRVQPTLTPQDDFTVSNPQGATPPIVITPNDPPVEFEVTFEPRTDTDMRSGTIEVRAANGDSALISVRVGNPNAAQIEVDTRELRYVDVQSPQSETKDLTITNNGGPTAAPLTVTFALDPTQSPDYSVVDASGNPLAGGQCQQASPPQSCSNPLVIARQDSHVISVTYAPTTAEASNATLRISSNDPDPTDSPILVDLIGGGGTGFVVSDTANLTWTAPATGASETMTVVLTNEGNAPVELTGFELRNFVPADSDTLFDVVPAQTLPVTLQPAETLSVDVTFTRPADEPIEQARQGDIVFLHDAGSGETIVTVGVTF